MKRNVTLCTFALIGMLTGFIGIPFYQNASVAIEPSVLSQWMTFEGNQTEGGGSEDGCDLRLMSDRDEVCVGDVFMATAKLEMGNRQNGARCIITFKSDDNVGFLPTNGIIQGSGSVETKVLVKGDITEDEKIQIYAETEDCNCEMEAKKAIDLIRIRKENEIQCETIQLDVYSAGGPGPASFTRAKGELCLDIRRVDCTVQLRNASFESSWLTFLSPLQLVDIFASAGLPVDLGPVNVSALEADFSYEAQPTLIDVREGISKKCCGGGTREERKYNIDIFFNATWNVCPLLCFEVASQEGIVDRKVRSISSKCCSN